MKQAPQKPEPAAPKKPEPLERMTDAALAVKAGRLTPAEGYAAALKPDVVPERVLRIADPDHSLSLAAFTPRELDTLKRVCRDADNELGLKALAAGLARGGE